MLSPFMGKISVKLACFSRDCSVKPSTLGPYWKSLTHIEKRGREGKCKSSRFDAARALMPPFPSMFWEWGAWMLKDIGMFSE